MSGVMTSIPLVARPPTAFALHLSALCNRDILHRSLAPDAHALHHLDDVHALDDLAKDDMLAIQMRRRLARDEELTAIRIRARVLPFPRNQHP